MDIKYKKGFRKEDLVYHPVLTPDILLDYNYIIQIASEVQKYFNGIPRIELNEHLEYYLNMIVDTKNREKYSFTEFDEEQQNKILKEIDKDNLDHDRIKYLCDYINKKIRNSKTTFMDQIFIQKIPYPICLHKS